MNGDLGLGVIVSMKDAFSQNAARVQTSMQSLDATVAASSERMTRNLDRIQKGTMMIGAGLALMAVPVGLVASTAATQKALGELSSLGVKDLRAIEDAAESFTNKWSGSNKAEFITAAYDVRSALSGLTDEAVGSFTAMAALTGKATKATTEEMVGTFTTAYGIFKPLMQDMSDAQWARTFAGAMAQTVASFKTNGRQMADAIKNIGAVAASSNVPLQEQLAILGQLQTTMPGSEAGTLYKAFIMKAAEAGEKLGLSFVDSTGRLKGIIAILEEIKGRFPDLSQAAAQVEIKKAFGSDEAVKFLLQMSQGAEALESNIQSVARAMKTGTAVTEEMAQAMNMDIGSQFKLLWQQIANLSEILGRTLLPVVTPIIQGVSKAVLFFQKLAKSMPGLTRVLLTLSMALGAVLAVVGGVIAAAGTIGLMLPAIKAGLAAMGAAVAGVGSAFAAYFLPVVAVIGGVVLAVYLLRRAWETNFGGIRDMVLGAWEKVKLVFQGIRELISSLSGGSGRMSAELARKLEQAGLMGLVVTV
ncbi:MAG: phage tail tape measure protein, partial [bacterium]